MYDMRLRAKVTKSTGNTRHSVAEVVDGRNVAYTSPPFPSWVEIVIENDEFWLFRLDEEGECVADTLHFTLDEAKRQANFEYGITSDEWFE
jgi:hypothetical protein